MLQKHSNRVFAEMIAEAKLGRQITDPGLQLLLMAIFNPRELIQSNATLSRTTGISQNKLRKINGTNCVLL